MGQLGGGRQDGDGGGASVRLESGCGRGRGGRELVARAVGILAVAWLAGRADAAEQVRVRDVDALGFLGKNAHGGGGDGDIDKVIVIVLDG